MTTETTENTGVITQSVALNTKEAEAAVEATPTEKVEEPGKLSRRDALEVAMAAKETETKEPRESTRPVKRKEVVINEAKEAQKYEAPSEYNAEEREIFAKSTPEQQATSLRLFKSFQDRRTQLSKDLQENAWVKKLAEDVTPFLKSTGEKMTPHEALTAALKLRQELEDGNPVENAMRYLKRKGIEVPEGLANLAKTGDTEDPKYIELRKELDSIKLEKEKETIQREAHGFLSDWENFQGQTNAAKSPRFPDINNSESGQKLAGEIGTLVGGKTDLSRQFITKVLDRNPKANRIDLFTEAYRWLGGKIDDTAAPKAATTQQHINRSNRAAASVPGSGSAFQPTGAKKMSRIDALKRAAAEMRGE